MEWHWRLAASLVMSVAGYLITCRAITRLSDMFVRANLYGVDMSKKDKRKIPEAMGLVCGCVYLIIMFLFIPVPFGKYLMFKQHGFPHEEFVQLLAALLSICCMLLLGFADDVLELKWRHKLWLPSVASLPLLMVYLVTFNWTLIAVPRPLRWLLGLTMDLGPMYYVYMGMLAVFCTNAINILSGVNGLEVGQAAVIAISLAAHNTLELAGPQQATHVFSLCLLLPFLGVTLALLKFNWYPARVFVGDTYCYFAGMTFAVIGILGHFSKTMLLFFVPQIANFIYSLPQIFHLLPCPRHRLPRYDSGSDRLYASTVTFPLDSLTWPGRVLLRLGDTARVLRVTWSTSGSGEVTVNNLTIINLLLLVTGPMHERRVTCLLLAIQVLFSVVAFTIRYPLAGLFYDVTSA